MVRLLCYCMVAIHRGYSSHGRVVPTVLLYGREVATYYVTVWKIPIILLDGKKPTMLLYGREVLTRLCMVRMYLPGYHRVGRYLPNYHMMGTYIPRLLYGRDVPTRLLYGRDVPTRLRMVR